MRQSYLHTEEAVYLKSTNKITNQEKMCKNHAFDKMLAWIKVRFNNLNVCFYISVQSGGQRDFLVHHLEGVC